MKKRVKNLKFSLKKAQVLWIGCMMLSIISINDVQAKTVNEEKKTITEEIEVNSSTIMSVDHDFGDIKLKKYEGTTAKIVVDITVRADDNDVDLNDIIEKYKIDVSQRAGKIEVKSSFGIKSWVINSGGWFSKGKHYIEFKDGTKINAKITDLDAQLTLFVPKIAKLELDHKHHNIFGDDVDYDLKLNLFDGDFDLGHLNGSFELNLKHGSGKSGDVSSANIDLFDSDVKMQEGGDIILKSRHSDLQMEKANSMKIDLWDSEVKMNRIESIFDGKNKHSKVFIDNIGSSDIELFDSRLEVEKIGELKISGKHSNHTLGVVKSLTSDCFDCRFNIGSLQNLLSNSSKHSTYHIEQLNNGITFKEGFDDHIEVDNTSSNFSGLDFNGKHSTIKLDLLESVDYQVDVNVEHGNIDLLTDEFDLQKHVEKNSLLTLLGKKKGATDLAPIIKIRGSVVNLDIEE